MLESVKRSPLVFNIVMDTLITTIKGYEMRNDDEAILIVYNEHNLQKLLHKFNIMKISTKKQTASL